jgi:hypothetical protein
MLGGDAWVDSIGAVVCHDKWCVHGAVLANSKLLLHMVRVQATGVRDQSQYACCQPVFHSEYVRREPGGNDETSDDSQIRISIRKSSTGSYRLVCSMDALQIWRSEEG